MPIREVSSRHRLKRAAKQRDAYNHRARELLAFAPVNDLALNSPVWVSVIDRVADSGGVGASLAIRLDAIGSVANPFGSPHKISQGVHTVGSIAMLYGQTGRTTPILFAILDIAIATTAARTVANQDNVLHHPFPIQVIFGRVGSLATIDVLDTGGLRVRGT